MPRTRQTHSHHISALKRSVSSHASTTCGITQDSILNSFSYFPVTEGLCPDVMHDVLEGVAQHEVKELLNYLFNSYMLTLYELNSEIENLNYIYADITDKPTQLSTLSLTLSSSDHNLKQ